MDQTNLVQDVSVEIGAQSYTATYFIEGEVIHAIVNDRRFRLPLGAGPAEEVIKSHIAEELGQEGRSSRNL